MNSQRKWCVVSLLVAIGCGKPAAPDLPAPHPVHGKVTYTGKPAQNFRVTFHRVGEQAGPAFAPSAVTDAAGEYRLQSYHPGDGAPTGDYTVTFERLRDTNTSDPADGPRYVDQLQGRFNKPSASQFKVTVHEGDNELPPFDLK